MIILCKTLKNITLARFVSENFCHIYFSLNFYLSFLKEIKKQTMNIKKKKK